MSSQHAFMPQTQSPLFRTPAEIRNEIYSYFLLDRVHVPLEGVMFQLSRVLDQAKVVETTIRQWTSIYVIWLTAETHKMYGCAVYHGQGTLEVQKRWSVQKRRRDYGRDLAPLYLFFEIADLLTHTAIVEVVDLITLDHLSYEKSILPFPGPPLDVTQLSITLRLPLEFSDALENPEDTTVVKPELAKALKIWRQLGTTISLLENLRALQIWLDHDEPGTWSVVNERAVLAPFTPIFRNTHLTTTQSLPKLHPKFEKEQRHFVHESQAPCQLQRRLRRRVHTWETVNGREIPVLKADFPFSWDIYDKSIEETEAQERVDWMNGIDVEKRVNDFIQMLDDSHCNI
ncbi:hypothetical protein BDV96DRAFT_598659 [Lophiotrema nucula]|uniref:Uncharacterized protein n=1 Tax=Lophiotrema nucula TaxID=690887 RepID=A0A6A5ZCZ4_9PLEO|nr:hypothetical protein BDV96DRAFT_598659 [Lophiotrema nucula]